MVDVSVGEPYLVRNALGKHIDLKTLRLDVPTEEYCYQNPSGYNSLVKLLSNYYGAPTVITNGAKQALAASFYALNQMGFNDCGMKLPYWALIPPLSKQYGIKSLFHNPLDDYSRPYLLLSPNNPDGSFEAFNDVNVAADKFAQNNMPFIHDAAYYTYSYVNRANDLLPFGSAQIYSASKMLGLSSVRVGWITSKDEEFLSHVKYYMETTTVGSSVLSQKLIYNILSTLFSNYAMKNEFENETYDKLTQNKKLLLTINNDLLDVPKDIELLQGMFAFIKVNNTTRLNNSLVNFINGDPFGKPGYVRMNLAFEPSVFKTIIDKINEV